MSHFRILHEHFKAIEMTFCGPKAENLFHCSSPNATLTTLAKFSAMNLPELSFLKTHWHRNDFEKALWVIFHIVKHFKVIERTFCGPKACKELVSLQLGFPSENAILWT